MKMTQFEGQTVVVTGATRGIGKAIAEAFLENGSTVIGTYSSDKNSADQFIKECEYADQLHLEKCDVGNADEVSSFYKMLEQQFSHIEILINNAGIRRDAVLALMKTEEWENVISVNLTGTFLMSKHAVLLMMKKKYGRIINITSPIGHLGFSGQSNYAASKAGQVAMARSLSKETAKKKITVNCVSPGFIDTGFLQDLSKEQTTEYKKSVPMRRFGTPQEVADAVLFLASPKASYITGAVIDVNGGI